MSVLIFCYLRKFGEFSRYFWNLQPDYSISYYLRKSSEFSRYFWNLRPDYNVFYYLRKSGEFYWSFWNFVLTAVYFYRCKLYTGPSQVVGELLELDCSSPRGLFGQYVSFQMAERSEPVFVNLLRSPGIDSQPGLPVQQPYLSYRPSMLQAGRTGILGIDSWSP